MNERTHRADVQWTSGEENRLRMGCKKKRGCNFIRYADDFSIYTRSKSEARSIGNEVYLFLRDRLELQINREKSGIRRPSNFTVLGHTFTSVYKKGSKGQYQLIVSKRSWAEFKRKLKRVTKKTLGYSFSKRLSALKLIYQGWINNDRLSSIYTKLKKVDEWLRNRLRYCIWHDWRTERKDNVLWTFLANGPACGRGSESVRISLDWE